MYSHKKVVHKKWLEETPLYDGNKSDGIAADVAGA